MELNQEQQNNTTENWQETKKSAVIEQLKKLPIVEIACKNSGIGRTTYYRWREQDEKFRKAAEEAVVEGEAFINDLGEAQIISMMKDKNISAIQLWLRSHHAKYSNKVEVTATIKETNTELSPEQKALVEEALRLAVLPVPPESLPDHGKSNESS